MALKKGAKQSGNRLFDARRAKKQCKKGKKTAKQSLFGLRN